MEDKKVYELNDKKVPEKKSFWQFIAGFFQENAPESMNRVLSLLFGVAAVVFGVLFFVKAKVFTTHTVDASIWLSIAFAVIAMLNKNIQKIVEKIVELKFKK